MDDLPLCPRAVDGKITLPFERRDVIRDRPGELRAVPDLRVGRALRSRSSAQEAILPEFRREGKDGVGSVRDERALRPAGRATLDSAMLR